MDAHVHVASDDQLAYPRRPTGLGSEWWRRTGYGASNVRATLQEAGIGRMVVVQPSGLYWHDNTYVIDVASRWPGEVRAVVAVDPDGERPADAVAEAASATGVSGIRCVAVHPSSRWIGTPRADKVFAAASVSGLTVVLVVFAEGLEMLAPVIGRYPSTPVVIDHCGFPEFDGATIAAGSTLLAMAKYPHVCLKITSHNLVHLRELGEQPTELVDQLAERFGTSRLLWGSDYPQTAHSTYASLVELAGSAFAELTVDERAAVTGGNACRLFDFPAAPPAVG